MNYTCREKDAGVRCKTRAVAHVTVRVEDKTTMADHICFDHLKRLLRTTSRARTKILSGVGPVETTIKWH